VEERFLVTGPCGQDGRILISRLLRENKSVGAIVRSEHENKFLSKYSPGAQIFIGDLNDKAAISRIVGEYNPSAIFHLAAKSSVAESWKQPELTYKVNFQTTKNLLEIIQTSSMKEIKFYFSASSEMYGISQAGIHNEATRMYPVSPYAKSKFEAFTLIKEIRKSTDRFLVSGILFNHESPLRDERFVTRKISMAVAKISLGLQEKLILGDLNVVRDWGWAPDYVDGMLKIVASSEPKDYLLATGICHSLEYFVQKAFAQVGISDWENYVKVDHQLYRKQELKHSSGDPSRAYHDLGWKAEKSLDFIIRQMLENDIEILKGSAEEGFWKLVGVGEEII
jgi:GDPmannose 4,6-dehydratase